MDVHGKINPVRVEETCEVDDLRNRIIPALLNLGSIRGSLILPNGRRLEGKKTLKEEGINNKECILFIPSRSKYQKKSSSSLQKSPQPRSQYLSQSPSKDDVAKLTAGIPASAKERTGFAGGLLALLNDISFHRRMRDALICLVNTACKLQSLDNGDEDDDDSGAEDNKKEVHVDQDALSQLTEMGFSDTRATKALLMNNMSSLQAMEWLIQHQGDSDIDEPIPPAPTNSPQDVTLSQTEATLSVPAGITKDTTEDSPAADKPDKHSTKVNKTMKHSRRRKWEFVPDQVAVYKLKQMGFEESDVLDALRVCNNNESAACEWLLGDRIPGPESVDQGLSPQSQEFHEIFKEPAVHLGLMSPRNLRILEDIIQNQPLLTQYLGDPELGPLLLHVARIVLDKPTGSNADL